MSAKLFKSQDELDGVCDYIIDNLNLVYKDTPKEKEFEEYIITFKGYISIVKEKYFTEIKTNCRKDLTKELYAIREKIDKYKGSLPEKRKIKLRVSVIENFRMLQDLLKKCLLFSVSTTTTTTDYYKTDLKKFLDILIKIIHENIMAETERNIDDFQTNLQSKKKFRFFLLNTNRGEMTIKEINNVLSIMYSYEKSMRVMAEELRNGEMKDYMFSMLNMWRANMNKAKDPYFKKGSIDKQLISYCALMVIKRVLLAIQLTLEDQQELFIKYMDRLKPDLETLDDMMKTSLNLKQQRKYNEITNRLRERMEQKLKRQETSQLRHQATEQQIRQWQQRMTRFLGQLEQEQQTGIGKPQTSLRKPQTFLGKQQQPQQLQEKKQQHSGKQQFIFDYVSPAYQHHQDKRISQEQNRMLQRRKIQNIENVQSSIISQSMPTRIMEIAINGNYSSILLVDVANKKRGFATQQQMLSNLDGLIPWDVPKVARRKPLYVLVEQTDLDQTAMPKATLEDHSGVLLVKVSCAKQTQDGRRIDCYKKEKQGQFTKNPMDDFVLLTLRYALRSYYYKYTKSNTLKKLENVEQLFVNNPFNLLLEEEEIGDIVREAYNKIKFDKKVPYAWIVSNDQWKDWKRKK